MRICFVKLDQVTDLFITEEPRVEAPRELIQLLSLLIAHQGVPQPGRLRKTLPPRRFSPLISSTAGLPLRRERGEYLNRMNSHY